MLEEQINKDVYECYAEAPLPEKDLEKIHKKFDTFADRNKIIATTEKDWMRLISFKEHIERMQWPLFVQYMSVKLDRENEWLEEIKRYVRTI